jgi:hypothetical protein
MVDGKQKRGRYFKEKIQGVSKIVREWLSDLAPIPGAERGAAIAVGVVVIVVGTYLGTTLQSGFGILLDFMISFIASILGYLIVFLVVKVGLVIIRKIPAGYIAALVSGFIAMLFFFEGIPWESIWHISLGIVFVEILLGIIVFELLKGGWRSAKLHKRVLLGIIILIVVGVNVGGIIWLTQPGVDGYLLEIEPFHGKSSVLEADPSSPGPYPVNTLYYGSGTDQRRPEFGESVDIDGMIRQWYWGFGSQDIPLNGRVWYPEGEGPFPLVLIVHGNHYMVDYSDIGYDYLGELFASRGYIVVSVDENFFNGYLFSSVNWENDARAWLLLKHLDVWRSWNQFPGSPFEGLVDIDHIALIGHSRGGEAVAHAAAFNRLSHYPDNANIRWDFNFGIQSVVAIAPIDKQYEPADHPTQLTDVNYLILQGAHDADISEYKGYQQYQRVNFSDADLGRFKSGLYIYQANHSRFNSAWGLRDFGLPKGFLLNQEPLLSPEEHRQITAVFISAFLDTTLKGVEEYIPIFEDYRNAGDWLPQTLYINQFQDNGHLPVVNYEEDFDVTSTTLEGGKILGGFLSRWKEEEIKYRTGVSQDNHAAALGWNRRDSWYKITLPPKFSTENGLNLEDYLVFNLADGRGLVENGELLDFTIILGDDGGESASLLVSDNYTLLPQFPVQFTRLDYWEKEDYQKSTEVVFQSIRIPISTFKEINPTLNLDKLKEIRFSFDQVDSGTIILDEIGFDLN